jgi:capsular exopolysaccharide synthesis family protein
MNLINADLLRPMPLPGIGAREYAVEGPEVADPFGSPDLVAYGRAVLQYKWVILAFTVAGALVAALVTWQITPMYRSTATVLIEPSAARVVSIEGVLGGPNPSREYFQTQAERVKSTDILARASRATGLASRVEFNPHLRPKRAWRAWLESSLPSVAALLPGAGMATSEASTEALVMQRMSDRLSVEPVRLSQLLRVGFEASDPAVAAEVANAIAAAYIQADLDAQRNATRGANLAINNRLADLKSKLDASEAALQAYRDREGLIDSKSTPLGGSGRQLEDLIQRMVEARARRAEAEEAHNAARGAGDNLDSVPSVVRNAGVQRAREVETDAKRALAEIAERAGPANPKYAVAEAELAAARANTRRLEQNVVASMEKEYSAARATERQLQSAIAQTRGQIQSTNGKEIQLGMLEREAATNRQLYQTFLSRLGETAAANNLAVANARVVEPAVPGLQPAHPRVAPVSGGGAALGLFLGLLFAVVRKRLDNGVNTTHDVEARLDQRLLAAVPFVRDLDRTAIATAARRSRPVWARVVRDLDRAALATVMLNDPDSPFAEAIRTAGTALMLDAAGGPKRVVVVTSSLPGEGKSTFATNLALWLARSRKVLLVEADMRRPSIPVALAVAADQKGLAELLAGTVTLQESVITSGRTGLHLMVCGRRPPNPLELFLSTRFKEVIGELKSAYDIVVVNTPPMQLVADALVVGVHATGVIYVVKAGDTAVPLAQLGLRRIGAAGIRVIGVVLNQIDFEKAARYHGEYSGFGGYGAYADGGPGSTRR